MTNTAREVVKDFETGYCDIGSSTRKKDRPWRMRIAYYQGDATPDAKDTIKDLFRYAAASEKRLIRLSPDSANTAEINDKNLDYHCDEFADSLYVLLDSDSQTDASKQQPV